MKRSRRVSWCLILASLSLIGFTQPSTDGGKKSVKKQGRGTLVAQGTGSADVKGDGRFEAKGEGTLVIHVSPQASTKAQIKVRGFGFQKRDGNVYYYQGRGVAVVRGKDIGLSLTGKVDGLRCTGRGTALLRGKGEYRTRGAVGSWSEAGTTVPFGRQGQK